MPVRVVVSLLGTLVTTAIAIGILASVYGRTDAEVVAAERLVGDKETWEGGRGRQMKGTETKESRTKAGYNAD